MLQYQNNEINITKSIEMYLDYSYECTLSILIENQPSILPRILGLLSRRGFIIESLSIGSTEYQGLSRIIIVLPGNLKIMNQLTRQLYKILPTIKIFNLTNVPSIIRKLILLKLLATADQRQQILKIAQVFNLNIIDCTNNTITLQIVGDQKKIIAIEQVLHKFGILEKVETGMIGLTQESLTSAQLYTLNRNLIRRKMTNCHFFEIEAKLYI